jgi:hypothetical protein
MRLWPRRPPATNQAGLLRDPRIHLAPIEIRHELRHVYEPRPRPDSVRLVFESEGRMFTLLWPHVGLEHELDVPAYLLEPGAPRIKLHLVPDYWRSR